MFAWVIFVFSFSSAISRLSIIWSLSPFFNIYIYPSIHCCISGLTPLRCDWSSQSSAKHRKCVLPAFLVLFVFAPFCSFGFIGLLLFVYLCVLVRCFFCILYVELCLEFWLQIFVALSPVFGLSFFFLGLSLVCMLTDKRQVSHSLPERHYVTNIHWSENG